MKYIKGNIWDSDYSEYVCIPTNMNINIKGENVMGSGLAKQCKQKYPEIPLIHGNLILNYGIHVYKINNMIMFPTKYDWNEKSSLKLIEQSAYELMILKYHLDIDYIKLPKIGCECGRLTWDKVCVIINKIFDDSIIIVEI